jgi:hypothetical protein
MKYYVFLLAGVLLLSSCASSKMQVAADQSLASVQPGKAQLIFMRSSFVGSAIQASIFDVSSGEPSFIGIISNGTKLAHTTSPGKKTFMVVSESADFMKAELAANKTYYGMVTPRMGVWKARFSLYPIKEEPDSKFTTSSNEFKNWVKNTKLVNNTPESEQWARDNSTDIRVKYIEYWAKWQTKTLDEKRQLTLIPSDGI